MVGDGGGGGWMVKVMVRVVGTQRGTGVLPHRSNSRSISWVTFVRRIPTFLVGRASSGIWTDATPPTTGEKEKKKHMHPTAVKAADDLGWSW